MGNKPEPQPDPELDTLLRRVIDEESADVVAELEKKYPPRAMEIIERAKGEK